MKVRWNFGDFVTLQVTHCAYEEAKEKEKRPASEGKERKEKRREEEK